MFDLNGKTALVTGGNGGIDPGMAEVPPRVASFAAGRRQP